MSLNMFKRKSIVFFVIGPNTYDFVYNLRLLLRSLSYVGNDQIRISEIQKKIMCLIRSAGGGKKRLFRQCLRFLV